MRLSESSVTFNQGVDMATPITDRPSPDPDHASTAFTAGTVAAKNSQVPDTPRFSPAAQVAIALLRVAVGFIFLWAFLDKFFGLGYATPSEKAWIHGGSPTNGFLSNVAVGPFESFFHSIAGTWWANTLFMLGLFAIGASLILGVAMKITMFAGPLLLVMMWSAEWPMAQFTSAGKPTSSANPFLDDHLIYALVIIVLALIGAGRVYGLGNWWAKVTGHNTWLR
jgi:thiosulfate dehydrogenase (quinone) large subunit